MIQRFRAWGWAMVTPKGRAGGRGGGEEDRLSLGSRGQLKTGARDWSVRHVRTGVTANSVIDNALFSS